MALLHVLQYPDQRLKKIAIPIQLSEIPSKKIKTITDNMFETMYQAQGIGLAATQVDIHLQIITIDLSENKNHPICLINPKIISTNGLISSEEGCLSFPGIYAKIQRYQNITVEYFDLLTTKQVLNATDLLSICIQHEIDHLHGLTFFDHLSLLKKHLLEKKLNKLRKHNL